MGWAGHKARMGEIIIGCSVGKLEEKSSVQDLDVGGRIIVKCIFEKWDRGITVLIWPRIRRGIGLL
jgi:hypothetical protein